MARHVSHLALDMTSEAVSLFGFRDGEWDLLRSAVLSAGDFNAQIDTLRVEALVRNPSNAPVTIWLPAEQILTRQYHLPDGPRHVAMAGAREQLEADTAYRERELSVALSDARPGERTTVLAALVQTVNEARVYARKWGFEPGAVTTRHFEGTFSAAPVFDEPEARYVPALRHGSKLAMAAAALLTIGVVSYEVFGSLRSITSPVEHHAALAQMPPVDAAYDQSPATRMQPLQGIIRSGVQTLAVTKVEAPEGAYLNALGRGAYARAAERPTPAALSAPAETGAIRVGDFLDMPDHKRPSRLGSARGIERLFGILTLKRDLDGVRARKGSDEAGANSGAPPPVLLASLAPNPQTVIERAARPAPAERPSSRARTTQEPEVAAVPPKPRPATARTVPPEPEVTAPAGENTAPADGPVEQATVFASLNAPEPMKRPKSFKALAPAKAPKQIARRTPTRTASPRSVQGAATQHGLSLEQTSLIGVIDAKSGRRALIRMASGDFRKIGRGDKLDGWRVSSIGRDTVRLTKQGRNRTLLLVTR